MEDPAAIADRVAQKVVAAVPYRLAAAESEIERGAIFRLRYRTVIEMGWAEPAQLPEGVERNDDDEDAIHIGAWDGDELVGTARTVLPREGVALPLPREFGLEIDSPEIVEVGRLVIVPRLRGDAGHALVMALFGQAWLEMRARGFNQLISAVPPRRVDVYRSLGFTIIELGPTREHWGEERIPVRFDVVGSAPELRRIWGVVGEKAPAG
jgi:N-acyl-L-homoserine lactone synthetase